jgi:hypothetical protein
MLSAPRAGCAIWNSQAGGGSVSSPWLTLERQHPNGHNPPNFVHVVVELYLDLNCVAKNAIAHLDVSLFATNVFNNTSPIGMVVNNGVYHPRGRGLGFHISKRF